ncbi:MAG: hypothetical protein AAB601_02150 [Patescibacteria group bacterium]
MHFALGYLAGRLFYRVVDFMRHWYVKSAKIYWNSVINQLAEIDYTLAWRVTLRHLFLPLYGDYSTIGYVLGFLFRVGRLTLSSVLYLALFALAAALYVGWLLAPPFILLRIVLG